MLKACCGNSHFELTKSSKCHITQLFILYIGDQVTHLIVLSQWYKYGYYTWFYIGTTVVCISHIMRWLYCTWNCNQYLQHLLKRKHVSSHKISAAQCTASSLTKTSNLHFIPHINASNRQLDHIRNINIEQWKKSIYHVTDTDDDSLCSIEYDAPQNTYGQHILCTFCCFMLKCFLWHLLCNGGIIEMYSINVSKYSSKIIGSFMDLCHLHCLYESIIMTALVLLFGFNYLYLNDFKSTAAIESNLEYLSVIFIHLISPILSFISSCIFTVNFEKFRLIPLYNVANWQFSRHNIVAIYILITGDFLLRFVPLVLFWSFYQQQTENVYFIVSVLCVAISILLTFIYHIMCWYRWGFLRRECWIYEHFPFVSYQILNPTVNVLEINHMLGVFMRQILFLYASIICSNISLMAHIYFRPIVTIKYIESEFIAKCVRSECLIRHCLGIIIVSMVLYQGKEAKTNWDIVILILGLLLLLANTILVHNLSDSPLVHIDLLRVDRSKKRKSSHSSPVYVCHHREDSFSTESDEDSEAEENTWINSHSSYSKIKTLDPDDDRNFPKNIYKPSKLHWIWKCFIKIHFNHYDTQQYKSYGMEPWTRFAMESEWELDPMGFWRRKKNQYKNKKKYERQKSRKIYYEEEEMRNEAEMRSDPFYKQYATMNAYRARQKRRKWRRLLSHFASFSWNKRKWNHVYLDLNDDDDDDDITRSNYKARTVYRMTSVSPSIKNSEFKRKRRISIQSMSEMTNDLDHDDDEEEEEKKWYSALKIGQNNNGCSYSLIPSVSTSNKKEKERVVHLVPNTKQGWNSNKNTNQRQQTSQSKSLLSTSIPEWEELHDL